MIVEGKGTVFGMNLGHHIVTNGNYHFSIVLMGTLAVNISS